VLAIAANPVADGLLVARAEQSLAGDMLDGITGGDLQERGGPLADVRLGVVIAESDELRLLLVGKAERMRA
jgi:hypothetical protein